MEVRSIYRFARISAFKAREVTREIQGLPATDALDLLRFTPKKAAPLISKTLKSAIANAENNHNAKTVALVVKEAVVGEGSTIKRFIPKARGTAGPIRKRTSHIRIILTDEIPIVRKDKTKKRKGDAKKASKPKSETPRTKKSEPEATATPSAPEEAKANQ